LAKTNIFATKGSGVGKQCTDHIRLATAVDWDTVFQDGEAQEKVDLRTDVALLDFHVEYTYRDDNTQLCDAVERAVGEWIAHFGVTLPKDKATRCFYSTLRK